MSAPTAKPKKNKLTPVGFRVNDEVYDFLQAKALELSNYTIFAVCNSGGKNPGNVWEVSTKAHYGNEHFAIFPEDLISRIIKFVTEKGDWVLDPFAGRGTTGIVCAFLGRNFTGIDLYPESVAKAKNNIADATKGKL
jgi:DNA modification methylase